MDVEFFVHGVPKGQDYWGVKDDQSYISCFYDGKTDGDIRFVVECRKVNGKNYCYYTYLRCQNILDNDERAGSYFGMSLRLDVFNADILNVYNILNTIYNRYILGNILAVGKGNARYTISSFAQKSKDIDSIQAILHQLIQLSFVQADLYAIDQSFFGTESGFPKFNIVDCTKNNILAAIRKYSKVVVSPEFPTIKESGISQMLTNKYNALITSKNQEINDLNANLSLSKRRMSEQNATIEGFKSTIGRMQAELDEAKKKEQTGEPEIEEEPKENRRGFFVPLWGILSAITGLIALLIGLLYTVNSNSKAVQPQGTKVAVTDSTATLQMNASDTDSISINPADTATAVAPTAAEATNSEELKLHLFGHRNPNKTLKLDYCYELAPQKYTTNGQWNVAGDAEGIHIKKQDAKKLEVYFSKPGRYSITYSGSQIITETYQVE